MPVDCDPRSRRWTWIYVAAVLVATLPYLISFTSQLVSDDFILLYYYGRRPLWAFWEFFSPQTIWTYHPLQHYYYALGWHLSGIEPWSYRAMSLAFHLATVFLLMRFARDLTGSIHFGGCAALAFAVQWRHWEAVAWAASIATLQSTCFMLLACAAFLAFLRRRRPAAYGLMLLAAVGWCFAKETVVQLPLLLGLIYLYHYWRAKYERPSRNPTARESPEVAGGAVPAGRFGFWFDGARLLAGPVALVLVYVAFRFALVENTYTFARLGYGDLVEPPAQWPGNIIAWLDTLLNPLFGNDVLRSLSRRLALKAHWLTHNHVIAAVVLAGVALFAVRRRFLPLFGLGFMLIGMIPYFVLRDAHLGSSRYVYAALPGGSMLLVALGGELWRLTRGRRGGWASWLRVGVAATGGLWLVANLFQLPESLLGDRDANRHARELYDFFATQTDKADRPVLFVVDTEHVSPFADVELGWGMLESARLALGSDTVAAVELGFDLERKVLIEFRGIPEKYWVHLNQSEHQWEAVRIPDRLHLVLDPKRGAILAERP